MTPESDETSVTPDAVPLSTRRLGTRALTLIIPVAVVLVLGVVFAVLYNNYRRTPQYSLLQLQRAFKQHDMMTVEKYADVDGILEAAVDQLTDAFMVENTPKNGWEALGQSLGQTLVTAMKPSAKARIW